MFVKLGGYGSKQGNDKPLNCSQRPCPFLPRTSSRGLKIASTANNIGVRGQRLILKFTNIPATLGTCDFAFFYRSFA